MCIFLTTFWPLGFRQKVNELQFAKEEERDKGLMTINDHANKGNECLNSNARERARESSSPWTCLGKAGTLLERRYEGKRIAD